MSQVDEKDLASIKCSFNSETRVLRVRKDIMYNALLAKVAEAFGVPLIVDTYEDAEGEMITLSEGSNIPDLSTQLNFGAMNRPYALKLFLRLANSRRPSNAGSSSGYQGERKSSGASDEYIRLTGSKGVLHSATTGIRRRDSKNLAPPDEDTEGRRSSADTPYGRRPSLVEHVRQSSAGDSGRRGSVDSDGDMHDEVVIAGAPWEPAFSRTPIDATPLEWAMNSVQIHDLPRKGFGMTVEIPKNTLSVNVGRGNLGMHGLDPTTPDTPGSASSAMKTPTLSPMAFGQQRTLDPRFPMPSEGNGHSSNTVVMLPAPDGIIEPPFLRSMSSNGSSHSDLPSFHQQPFPNNIPGHFERSEFSPNSITSPHSPSLFRPPYPFLSSADIERELQEGPLDDSYSSDMSDVEVMDSGRNSPQLHFPQPASPHSPHPDHPGTPKQKSAPPSNNNSSSPRVGDLRSGMKTGGSGASRRAASVSSSTAIRPMNLAFKRGNLIGRGGFGSVYQGLLNNGQSVAVKVLELPPDIDPTKSSTYVSFLKEIDMLKALKHPNIVRYIGSTTEGSTINVLLEYVPGGSIASMVAKYGSFEEPMMQRFSRHILRALGYLHENNIAHRDVKGANILVDIEGVAKLADFGCSKSISVKSGVMGAENFQTMLGTPYWMAPEVMRQEGHGRMADIWSFGCTLIEMASGKPPWAKDYTQIFALLYEVGNSSKIPDIPAHLSDDLKDLLVQCLRRTPTERPTAQELLRHRWFQTEFEDFEDDESSEMEAPGPLLAASVNGFSATKKRSFNLTKSIASRMQALQEQPKSLDALPEKILLHILALATPATVTSAARSCARFRFLAQHNSVWVALANAQWPKLHMQPEAQASDVDGEADFGKKIFMAYLKYDRRFASEPLFRHVRTVKGHTKKVHAMQLLEGGAKLVTSAGDKKIKIWEISSSPASGALPSPSSPGASAPVLGSSSSSLLRDFDGPMSSSSASLSSNSSSNLATSSSSIKKKKASVTLRGHAAPVTCFHATHALLVSGSCDGMIKVWDLKTKKCSTTIRAGDHGITGLQIDEKRNLLVTSSTDGSAKLWDLNSFTVRSTLTQHRSTIHAMKFQGDLLATAGADKRVNIWNLKTGKLLHSLRGHTCEVHSVDIVGTTVIAGGADGSILEWSGVDAPEKTVPAPKPYAVPVNLQPSPIIAVLFDGVNTVTAAREDGQVLFYRFHSGQLHSTLRADSGPLTSLASSNSVLATAGYGEKLVKLWALVNP